MNDMEIEKAIEILEEFVNIDRSMRSEAEYFSDYDKFCEERCVAIDTVLNALDNSISKDAIREKLEELNKKEKLELKGTKGQDRHAVKLEYMYKRAVLEQLLKGE